MAILERGEFTLESDFGAEQPDQSVNIRMPHQSGRTPLVFRVALFAKPSRPDLVRHTVLVQYQSPDLLLLNRVIVAKRRGFSARLDLVDDYLDAAFFNTKVEPDKYSVGTIGTGGIFTSMIHDITMGEVIHRPGSNEEGETIEVKDVENMRLFIVTSPKGSNRIAIPRDLHPYIGKGKKDLAYAVEFET